ncbi:c-type cytochrome [Sphingomonas koreensis]
MLSRIVLFVVGTAASLAIAFPMAGSRASAQDPRVGATIYKRCVACHTTTGKNSVGPPLNGVVGRAAGKVPRYAYSKAMTARGIVWDRATLDRFLARPQGVVPGTKMGFAGMSNPKERQDVIAYLAALK